MKRLQLTAILAALALLTSCGVSSTNGNTAEEAENTDQTEERQEEEQQTADTDTGTLENGEDDSGSQQRDGGPGGNGPGEGAPGGRGGPGGQGGGITTTTDPEIQAVLDENAGKFEQQTFTDPDTGYALEYSLYIPDSYDTSASYPLLMFIPDATGAGKSAQEIVEQYYGADVWVTDADQEKHPSFVLVPAFSETVVNDNWEVSGQVETAVRLLQALQETYSIDPNRLYTTGQSMGCMTSLYLNSVYPDLFAASMFVSGQWDSSVLKPLEEGKFFYITAGGDAKASGGQDEVMAMFDADGIPYAYGTWSAQDSAVEQDTAVEALTAQGLDANMVRFETGSVFKEGESGQEHMASFNYGYKLTAVRDWLFAQSKGT